MRAPLELRADLLQYKLNLAYHDAKFADLYEETMYNALLGGVGLEGRSYAYTNPLINTLRTRWHTCPCCVGNVSRTLLMMPTWMYVKSKEAIYVNLFAGSRVNVGKVRAPARTQLGEFLSIHLAHYCAHSRFLSLSYPFPITATFNSLS